MKISKDDAQFVVEGNESDWLIMQDGTWESETFQILNTFVRPNDTMLDMGAWIGPISLYCAGRVKKCYSFEPDPVAFKIFTRNISLNQHLVDKIQPMNMAITTDGQPVRLYSRHSHGDSGSSLLKRVKSVNDFVDVPSTTFQNFINTNNLTRIDFIKMDVEGSEFSLLPQMAPYLASHKPTMLVSFHHHILCESLELQYFPRGILRRLYRMVDPGKKFIRSRATKSLRNLLRMLSFYSILDAWQKPFDPATASDATLEKLDMLIFISPSAQ